MPLPVVTATLKGVGWQRFQEKLQANLVGARAMARTRFMIGSSLPYASHWIEEGWREDPRFGRVVVTYRTPDVNFMHDAANKFHSTVRARRPESAIIGVAFNAAYMSMYADTIVQDMRTTLNNRVYSAPVPTRNGRRRYQRSHRLFNSIKAYRV